MTSPVRVLAIAASLLAAGCSNADRTSDPPTPTSVPELSSIDAGSNPHIGGYAKALDRAEATGLDDPGFIQLPKVDNAEDVRQYLTDTPSLGLLVENLEALVSMPDGSIDNCDGLAGRLTAVGSPPSLQTAAAGVPDAVGADLYAGLVSAAGDVVSACDGEDLADALNDLAWQLLLAQRWNESVS